MPELALTDAQRRRFESVREDLEAAFAPRYASVRDADVVDYLLDTYTPPEAAAVDTGPAASTAARDEPDGAGGSDAAADSEPVPDTESATEPADAGTGEGAARVSSMLRLLDDYADKWGEAAAGDAPYEVELPDGSTEPARTKDDVRRILYQNY